MGLLFKVFSLAIALICFTAFAVLPAFSQTSADASAILGKMDASRRPEGLKVFRCAAHIEILSTLDRGTRYLDPPGPPDENPAINITYVAPYDFRVEYSGPEYAGTYPKDFTRLRGDDPLTLANPALKQELLAVYQPQSTADKDHNGEACHVVHMMPTDWTKGLVPFDLYIRAADSLPVYTEVQVSADKGAVFFRTEIEYTQIDTFQVVGTITTTVEFTDLTNFIYKTSFSDYEINPTDTVLLNPASKPDTGDEGPANDSFADIYHGFEDPPLVVRLGGENALYSKLRFAFALEVPSKQVVKELEKRHDEITAAVSLSLEGRSWGDIKDKSYELGLELTDIINGMLTAGKVADFYFTKFEAER